MDSNGRTMFEMCVRFFQKMKKLTHDETLIYTESPLRRELQHEFNDVEDIHK